MSLSNRKEKILQAVVDSYVNSCQPVSSGEIRDKYLPEFSGATIRNELASLEEMGYLVQPHVSAGRVPTAEAYRVYVDRLMPRKKLSKSELAIIKKNFSRKIKDIDDMVRSTAKVISEITNLTGIAYAEDIRDDILQSVKIVKITSTVALFIIVTNRNIIKDSTANVPEELEDEYFEKASAFATSVFSGYKITDITSGKVVRDVHKEYKRIFSAIIAILKNYAVESDIALEGSSKLLQQPEYSNVEKAKAMLEMLETKEKLLPVIKGSDVQLSVKIGGDGEIGEGIPECAVVTFSYSVDGVGSGNAGVIGPMRMDYPKVVSVLDYIQKALDSLPEEEE